MARIAVVVLLLVLVLTPASEAVAQSYGESPAAEWLDSIRSVFDWLFSWWPTATSDKSSAMIVPDGINAPPRTFGSTPAAASAMIVPNGVAALPPTTPNRSFRREAVRE